MTRSTHQLLLQEESEQVALGGDDALGTRNAIAGTNLVAGCFCECLHVSLCECLDVMQGADFNNLAYSSDQP